MNQAALVIQVAVVQVKVYTRLAVDIAFGTIVQACRTHQQRAGCAEQPGLVQQVRADQRSKATVAGQLTATVVQACSGDVQRLPGEQRTLAIVDQA